MVKSKILPGGVTGSTLAFGARRRGSNPRRAAKKD